MSDEGYKGHRAGSKKGKLREIFDTKGRDTAVKAGERMGLTKGTVSSWLWAWGRDKKRATVGKLTPTAKKAMAKAKARRVLLPVRCIGNSKIPMK